MRVILAGGGTGGHIYPALALARHLRDMYGSEVLFVGTERGMEKDIVPAAGFELVRIPLVGLERRLSPRLGKAVLLAGRGVHQARRLLRRFRPDVVVGTGGYVAGPVVLAALLSRLPTVIHEQNAIPGFTNVTLARWVDRVCVSFPDCEQFFPRGSRVAVTGNPRASEAVQAAGKKDDFIPGLLKGAPLLLCVGGSHGAARLNDTFSESVEEVLSELDAQIVYITGQRYFEQVDKKLGALHLRFPHRLHVLPFHPNLPGILARTNLVVSRAGATTLSEITALGVPAILVPSPNVTKNHQEFNAGLLAKRDAAVMLRETELDKLKLSSMIIELLRDRDRLGRMSAACSELGYPDAVKRLSAVLHDVAEKYNKRKHRQQ
jgi:UDP-N-acetylglucosamine--N-acetylmuramyl-(pentapeptide) pyrophosphoryl-undecaprenol N-acetylglucosamine transferase